MMKTLVLIPAFGCDARLYAPQIASLSDRLQMQTIVPDANSYPGMVQQIMSAAPERFAILGTSMGGRAALETALAAPERVLALGIIGAAAGGVAERAAGLRRSARIRDGEHYSVVTEMAAMISHLPGPNGPGTKDSFIEMATAFNSEALACQSDALAGRIDRWNEVKTITCPTLCLWGALDKFSPAEDGTHLANAVQHGTYVELPECGHFPTLEYPVESTDAIRIWMDKLQIPL